MTLKVRSSCSRNRAEGTDWSLIRAHQPIAADPSTFCRFQATAPDSARCRRVHLRPEPTVRNDNYVRAAWVRADGSCAVLAHSADRRIYKTALKQAGISMFRCGRRPAVVVPSCRAIWAQ